MKTITALFLTSITLSSAAWAVDAACTQDLVVTTSAGSMLVALDANASKGMFVAAPKAELDMQPELGRELNLLSIQNENMICCEYADSKTKVVAGSERCLISVAIDGKFSKLDVTFIK